MIRLYVPEDLTAGAALQPSPDQARYLTSVMRLNLGDTVALFNGRDGEWTAQLTQAGKRGCTLTLDQPTRPQAWGPDLTLVVALVKRGPLETIIEKAVELGCRKIVLVTTRRTNAGHVNVGRLQAIATEAAEQCERLDVPEVTAPVALEGLLRDWDGGNLMFCDEAGDARPVLDALKGRENGAWAVLIGPEGGFAPDERQQLRDLPCVTPVTLGPRILRADTAAISALTLWQAALGDWRKG